MPKIFGRKSGSSSDAGDDDAYHDDMTITSGFSTGRSSVSDRIMGRMKMNLSIGSGGNSRNNASSSASVGSRTSVGSRMSTGRFGGKRTDIQRMRSSSSVGGSDGKKSSLQRKYGSSAMSSMGSSLASVNAMEEMDSNEAMALKGQTFGRRRTSGAHNAHGRFSQRKLKGKTDRGGYDPVEYSLAELRTMNEIELGHVMSQAGVLSEDISSILVEAGKIDTSPGSNAEDQRKNALVAFFVNSGRVKLVAKGSNVERRPALPSVKPDTVAPKDLNVEQHPTTPAPEPDIAVPKDSNVEQHLTTLVPEPEIAEENCPLSAVTIGDSSVKSSLSKKETRKSKLEKIAELKTDNSKVKRENKSLKKTMKKLLQQLANVIGEKEELKNSLDEEVEKRMQKEAQKDSLQSSLHSIDENNDKKGDAKIPQDVEINEIQPPFDVVAHNNKSESGKLPPPKLENSSWQSISSEKRTAKIIEYLKRKIKKEKDAHMNTEFRLKAEVEILAKEVDGLQRELALSLGSLDTNKRRARESREAISKLKHELRSTSMKVNELDSEAEARDKLIETFSKILLQKVGIEEQREDGELSVESNGKGLEQEEKLGNGVMVGQLRESLSGRKLPT